MKCKLGARGLALLITLVLVACGGEEPAGTAANPRGASTGASAGVDRPAPQPAAAGEQSGDLPETRPISEVEMKNYLGAMKDILALGESMKPASESGDALAQVAAGLSAEGEVGAILKKHHFDDLEHFQGVHLSVSIAYAALAWGEEEEFGREEFDELEALRPNLTDAQYQSAKRSIEETIELERRYSGTAGPNRDLVEKYRADLDTLFG